MEPKSTDLQRHFPCKQCGANLQFAPGTDALKCPYCGAENKIAKSTAIVERLDFQMYLNQLPGTDAVEEKIVVKCTCCAAETTLASNNTAGVCPFCGTGIVATGSSKRAIRPGALLPFRVKQNEAAEAFKGWVKALWFAPGALKRDAERAAIKGAYVPAWTYDTNAESDYTGQRGENYWETETYTENDAQGNTVTRTRQVQKIRWWPVSGHVRNRFDDVLVMATETLPPKVLNTLEPWDLPALIPYGDEYLSGFVAESYQIGLGDGFERAKGIMDPVIRQTVNRDIGGDHQQISGLKSIFNDTTFRHLLLPVWISAYTFQGKVYRFLVNARTGEAQGERPYSWVKITLLVLFILAVIAAVVLYARNR